MSESLPIIAVLAGGTSAEREVSLGSGKAERVGAGPVFPRAFSR
jgi:D-alanine-D-alanine ligase-like ATP-grasp enzyme